MLGLVKVLLFVASFRQAWQKLGAMLPEEAMQKYIAIVTELYPTWAAGSAKVRHQIFLSSFLLFGNKANCLNLIGFLLLFVFYLL